MNEQGSHEQENLAGMGTLLDMPIIVLFDTSVSHSFISASYVDAFELLNHKIEQNISVTSPVVGTIKISQTCSNVEFTMRELKLVAQKLQVMTMESVDIILGMDWLAENHITNPFPKIIPTLSIVIICKLCETSLSSTVVNSTFEQVCEMCSFYW